MESRKTKSMFDFASNDLYVEEKKISVPIRFECKVRYQCASSIITIPASIVRKLNLKLGETVIMNILKIDNQEAVSAQLERDR
jgi:hypothetical protein